MSERMLFCLGEGKYESRGEGYQKNNRIFNIQVTSDEFDTAKKNMPSFDLPIVKWIAKDDMTDDEKSLKSYWETTGGYLKTLSYKDAWKEAKMSDEFKKWVKELPNFNSGIFEEITGLKWAEESVIPVGKVGDVININCKIRARLTVYGHDKMSDKEFKFFKKWITTVVPQTAKNKRGELSKVFRQTLYKNN